MTTAWSWYVAIIVVINIAGCAWLLWWTGKRRPGDPPADSTSHYWDGDITEYNKPMPRWWINGFYLTIVFSIGYLIWYPGFGNFAGTSAWTSAREHDADREAAEQTMAAALSRFDDQPLEALARNPEALAHGQSVFANHCATCHGSDARGARGFPNLADTVWHWGGTPDRVLESVMAGRQAAMPALGAALGSEQALTETAVYVQSLSGQRVDPALAVAGRQRFEMLCVACHGADGTGNALVGAPDLSDDYWLYGGDFESIRQSISNGRNGQMPAHEPLIGARRARLAAAWVWSLSQPVDAPDGTSSAAATTGSAGSR